MLPIYMALIDDEDVSDFEVLYRACRNKAYIIAYKILKNESLAEECVSEVGQIFHVTRERIRQIEAKALRKLKHPTRSRKLRDYLE